jgi:hypothetical protein
MNWNSPEMGCTRAGAVLDMDGLILREVAPVVKDMASKTSGQPPVVVADRIEVWEAQGFPAAA